MLSIPLLRWLWSTAGVMLAGHLVVLYLYLEHGVSRDWGIPRHFDLNSEASFASFFQASPLLIAALVTLALAAHYRLQEAPLAGRWAAMSGLFLFMAIDELAQIHDLFTGPLRRRLDLDFGALYFTWLLPAVVFLGFCAWYFLPLVRSLPGAIRVRLVIAAGVYFGGAVVVEMLSGFVAESGRRSTPYLMVLTFEEACEIGGVLLALGVLLHLLRSVQPRTTFEILDGAIGVSPAASSSSALGPRAEQLP